MECPVCGTLMNTVCDLEQRDFDGSVFNFIGCVFTCEDCGMVRVKTGLTDSLSRSITIHRACILVCRVSAKVEVLRRICSAIVITRSS